jgi:hypothetical protein
MGVDDPVSLNQIEADAGAVIECLHDGQLIVDALLRSTLHYASQGACIRQTCHFMWQALIRHL